MKKVEKIRKTMKRICTNEVSGEERVERGGDLIYRNERKERKEGILT